MGKGKKTSKKNDDDDWENDIADIAKESGIDLNREDDDVITSLPKKKKKKKDKASSQNDSEMDQDFIENVDGKSKKPSFAALMLEEDDVEDLSSGDEGKDDEISGNVPVTKVDQAEKRAKKEKPSKGDKKKGKASKKKKEEDEEDLDAILADIEGIEIKGGKTESKADETRGKNKEETEVIAKDPTADLKEKENGDIIDREEGNIKDKENDTSMKINADEGTHEDFGEDDGPKLKSAAQKRAEKKEREKLKKKKEAKKKAEKKEKSSEEKPTAEEEDVGVEEGSEVAEKKVMEASQEGINAPEEAVSEEDGEEGEADKKKKKKKKKKGKDEEEKKKVKKPGKAAIKQMQEALEKLKLEEERLRQEEEAKQKAAEEAERQRLEKIRLEQERKEKKKQKKKEKIEKKKEEGRFLTPAQKEQKRRAEMMLEAMKQQGIEVPSKDAVEVRKKVQYGKRKKNQQVEKQTEALKETATEDSIEKEDPKKVEKEVMEIESQVEEEDTITDSREEEQEEEQEEDNDLPESWEEHHDDIVDKKDVTTAEPQLAVKLPEMKQEEQNDKGEKEAPSVGVSKESVAKAEETSEESDESESKDEESDESSEESEEDSESSEDEQEKMTPEKIKEKAKERIMKRREAAEAKRSVDKLRCPVICVLGHVDTGKTKILDKIRHTNVQDGEAGGITQQIGATMVPLDTLKVQTKMVKEFQKLDLKLPGLLIIDTPGHESFSNLRTRGSSLCDMAILVVDIMHGLEPQTIESINLLRKKHTPFIVALNKIDRLFEWKRGPASQFEDTLKKQKKNTKLEFDSRVQQVVAEFAEQGLNAELFYKNFDEKSYISLVPTSAHSGDGMGDLMALICKLTQTRLAKHLAYSEELQSTVMEVKALPGLGTTVDAILVNGKLREGDTIVTGGIEGPIVTQIRAILTPQPLRELRVKSNYIQHKELNGAQGCKITGKDLEKVMAGAPLFVAENHDEIEVLKDEVIEIMRSSLKAIKVSDRGVYVQASTLGSLEALLEFLKTSKIPYSGVNVGPVHKRDVMKTSVMLEHEPMYAVVLAFDVKVERDAQELADKEGIKIFTADIIYHLFDKFTAYTEEYKQKLKDKHKNLAVFPCKLRILPQHIFNSRSPIVVGVNIEGGTLRLGTPLTVPSKEFCDIGIVTGIEANHKSMDKAVAGQEVCVKIEPIGDAPKMYGRHFTHEDLLMSKISRESIDTLKDYFRDEMSKADWQLIIEMKKLFEII